MSTARIPMIEGCFTLVEVSDTANTYFTLTGNPWYTWVLATGHQGEIYADGTYTVVFMDNEAVSGSLSIFASKEWKEEFLFFATQFKGLGIDIKWLFTAMENLIFDKEQPGRLCIDYLRNEANRLIRSKTDGQI